MTLKVECELRRKGSRPNTNFGQSSSWKPNWRDDRNASKPNVETTNREITTIAQKGRLETQQRNRDIKCFKCHGIGHISSNFPNKRTMVMCAGEIVMDNEEEEESIAPLNDTRDSNLEYPVEGEALVTRHVLNTQVKEDDIEKQRENIFHTQCHVQNKVCSLIIDGGSCANVSSVLLVEKLQYQH